MMKAIEARVRDYLSDKSDVPVFTEIERSMPAEYWLIQKTGGNSSEQLSRATLAIRSISQSMSAAADLNEQLKALMKDIPTHENISKCTLNSDYNYTNTNKIEYRYQAVFDLTYYD